MEKKMDIVDIINEGFALVDSNAVYKTIATIVLMAVIVLHIFSLDLLIDKTEWLPPGIYGIIAIISFLTFLFFGGVALCLLLVGLNRSYIWISANYFYLSLTISAILLIFMIREILLSFIER